MTITIEAPAEIDEKLQRVAAREGVSVSEFALQAIRQKLETLPIETHEEALRAVQAGRFIGVNFSSEDFMAAKAEEKASSNRQSARHCKCLAEQAEIG